TFGDLVFTAGIPYAINTMEELEEIANKLLPEITKMPFHLIYPTGKKQESQDEAKVKKFARYYHNADIIAGDFHLIRRFMPAGMSGQTIFTNTTTSSDIAFLKEKGVGTLVTTTPEYGGRSFGTNVMEAALVAILNKELGQVTEQDYLELLHRLDFRPRIVKLGA
ncbi:MAG: quinate 5-dehydrogenase, partial [Firmicutes bacterium]|nr:quinate 5-dehydrogenase [Bacillota bacterium]